MNVNQVISLLVTATVVVMMANVGLSVAVADLLAVARNGPFIAKAFLANYVCVPAITVGLLIIIPTHPMVAVGFLVLAVCPGAPFGSPLTALAKGDVPISVGLMVILVTSSALLAPPLLRILLGAMGHAASVHVDAGRMIATLLLTQLLPLGIGLAVRQRLPRWAIQLERPVNAISKLLSLLTITVILAVHFPMLSRIRLVGFVGMFALLSASLAVGWVLGGPGLGGRKAAAITTLVRNAGVGLVVAADSFAGTPVLTTVLAYAIFELLGGVLFALLCGRTSSAPRLSYGVT